MKMSPSQLYSLTWKFMRDLECNKLLLLSNVDKTIEVCSSGHSSYLKRERWRIRIPIFSKGLGVGTHAPQEAGQKSEK